MELPTNGGDTARPELPQEAPAHLHGVQREQQPEIHPVSVTPPSSAMLWTMRLLEMNEFYPLHDAAIDAALTRGAPGNYALGYSDGDVFSVFYVGRSDLDLARCLHEWVGMPSRFERYCAADQASRKTHGGGWPRVGTPPLGRVGCIDSSYTHFACSYAQSVEEAYAKEWRIYDAFGGHRNLDNETPPTPPCGETAMNVGRHLRSASARQIGSRGWRDRPGWAQWVPTC